MEPWEFHGTLARPTCPEPAPIFDLQATLTFYSIAAAHSLGLCVVLAVFARFQPEARAVRGWIPTLVLLTFGFFLSGLGPALPRWATVVASNTLLLAAGTFAHAAFTAPAAGRRLPLDGPGLVLVALAVPAFVHWGLRAPDGVARSLVFSLAVVVLNGRTALHLLRSARRGPAPVRAMAVMFAGLTVWMLARTALLLATPQVPPDLRAANPTRWTTVFGYAVLVSLMSMGVMWLESDGPAPPRTGRLTVLVEYFRGKLLLLWSAVTVLLLAVVSLLGIGSVNLGEVEKARLVRSATLHNDAFVAHGLQLAGQVDTVLRAVRAFHRHGATPAETGAFLDALAVDRGLVEDIEVQPGPPAEDRLTFTREPGTGRLRVSRPLGAAGGRVLATVRPEPFARFFQAQLAGTQGGAVLLAGPDPAIQVGFPGLSAEVLRRALAGGSTGSFEATGAGDRSRRSFVHGPVGDLPLTMVTGFSDQDLRQGVRDRMRWLVTTSTVILLFTLLLAVGLTVEAKRRDDQERFMSMLSHELKTPLSVLRLALGAEAMAPGIRTHARHAVEDLNAVIDRCLQADRLAHGRLVPVPDALQVGPVLEELRAASLDPERLRLEAGDLPDCAADPQLLRIILGNLLDNALKYGPADQPVTVLATAAPRQGRAGVAVRVANPVGPAGRPDPERVFAKYYRAEGAHTRTGSGLGLHLSASLARLIGGDLRHLPGGDEVVFELWVPA